MIQLPPAGSIGLVHVEGIVGEAIRVGQLLDGDGFRDFEHAFILYQAGDLADARVIEAESEGVRSAPLAEYTGRRVLWLPCPPQYSTGMQVAAVSYIGVPYAYTDYAAVAAHRLRLPVGGVLRRIVQRSHHVICSQLAAACADKSGWPLVRSVWPGYVTPGKLAGLAPEGAVPELIE